MKPEARKVALLLSVLLLCSAWAAARFEAGPQAQGKQPGKQGQQGKGPAKGQQPAAQPAAQPPPPPPPEPMFGGTVTLKTSRPNGPNKEVASAGFNGLGPGGQPAPESLSAAIRPQDSQAALRMSVYAVGSGEVAKFIEDGHLGAGSKPGSN